MLKQHQQFIVEAITDALDQVISGGGNGKIRRRIPKAKALQTVGKIMSTEGQKDDLLMQKSPRNL